MTIAKMHMYASDYCAIMLGYFWSIYKHCDLNLRKLPCCKHCFCWSCLTNGQQQLWCNNDHWLPCCYRTERQIIASMYLWDVGETLPKLMSHIHKRWFHVCNSLDC